jgi:hypothetical protein
MPFHPLKLVFYLVIATLEVTLLNLGVTLLAAGLQLTSSLDWAALLLACLAGAWTISRFDSFRDDDGRLHWLPIGVWALTMAFAVKVHAGGGWSPLSGWSLIWPFGGTGAPDTLSLLGLLIVALWNWWRGMSLVNADHGYVVGVLQRGVLLLVALTILLTPFASVNLGAPPLGPRLAAQALAVAGLGLFALSLARIIDEWEAGQTGGIGYWLRSSMLTSLGVLLLGTLLLTLVSNTATLALRSVLAIMVGVVGLLLLPVVWLLAKIGEWLMRLVDPAFFEPNLLPSPLPSADPSAQMPSDLQIQIVQVLQVLLSLLVYLVPVLVLLLLILTMRRRQARQRTADGVLHESLWSWQRLGADLLAALKGLRLPTRAQGLRDVLARLRRDDPAQRIRRRYVELLLLGEDAARPRLPQQTPLEYSPHVAPLTPGATADLQTLTDLYDQARYAPDTIKSADADLADAAWTAIQAQSPKENR